MRFMLLEVRGNLGRRTTGRNRQAVLAVPKRYGEAMN